MPSMETENLELFKTKYGFYQYRPLPSVEELSEYYGEKYYQEGKGSYEVNYTDEEIQYMKNKVDILFLQTKRLTSFHKYSTYLDLGCGEGWALDRFHQAGFRVRGVDYSGYALRKFHPHLAECFQKGDAYGVVEDNLKRKETYDVISLLNVVEHVLDPVDLLEKTRSLLSAEGVLIIVAPNDFSPLQEYLLEKGHIDKSFWLHYPDHISYFNKDNMTCLLTCLGFSIEAVLASNPIDLNLLNDNGNYIKDPAKGKNTYFHIVRTDNFLASLNSEKWLDLYKAYADLGLGRNLAYFAIKKKE
jgi:2-polyprenyl-3-methyl-5-hydroxy-6-metoxy-1,4-benzoquinol methylase